MPFAQATPAPVSAGAPSIHPTHHEPAHRPHESQEIVTDKVIRKEGNDYVLYSKDGKKKLGTHGTRAEAEAQERAIYANRK